MPFGVRAFIFCVFSIVGLSFLATTAVLVWEFWRHDWLTIASFYSHLFIFFPTFGIVALIAFYTPACVFTDLYMRYVPFGRPRFITGFVVAVVLSIGIAQQMTSSQERSIFEVAPNLLRNDAGESERVCNPSQGNTCDRLPIMTAVDNVRRVSQSRIGLSDLARNCRPDKLKDPPAGPKRYCFTATVLPADIDATTEQHRLTDADCCAAQARFTSAVKQMHDSPGGRSLTSIVHTTLLPFKIFFALILIVISVLLAVRHKTMVAKYEGLMPGIERGVLVGAAAMVIYPVMSHAFLQSAALLYFGGGPAGGFRSTAPLISLAFGVWGLLLLFFFFNQHDKDMQSLGRIGGLIGSAIAVLKYDQIVDLSVRLFGTGASWVNIAVLCALAVGAWLTLVIKTSEDIEHSGGDVSLDAGTEG
jgi:hypothetical protein